jgi:hypothetical protein
MTAKLTVISFVLCLFFGFAPSIALADFAKGVEATKRNDYLTSISEWTPLAEKGDALAQYNLGVLYYTGQGVPHDHKETGKWFRLAADQGNVGAQQNLGSMYGIGDGVPQDYKEAIKWYRLAFDHGHLLAQFNLGSMYINGQGLGIRTNRWRHEYESQVGRQFFCVFPVFRSDVECHFGRCCKGVG